MVKKLGVDPRSTDLVFTEPSRTKQSFKDECDINQIIKKYKKVTGVDFLKTYHGFDPNSNFGDFSQITDYRSAIEAVRLAQSKFDALPAIVRESFGNDPEKFVNFAIDPANIDTMRQWGLADPKEVSDAEMQKE